MTKSEEITAEIARLKAEYEEALSPESRYDDVSKANLQKQYEQLTARLEELKRSQSNEPIRISPKGGVSFYGVGRYPVTLYASQWERLFNQVDAIKAFITANEPNLATKPARG